MAAPAPPVWRALGVCPADPLAPSHPQANHSQSQGCRGEVSEETQHLIGDGFSDWMTEEVDFSSYLPNPPSPPSPTNASLPPSPLQNDTQVPSDLEVMTSLLQEELAQLEDYFLSEPLPEKGPKFGRCDKGPPPAGPQAFCQVPYASYSASGQSESSPLLVTLATGELDLLSICGGPIGRSKIPRHAPYSCSRPKRLPDGARLGDEYENSLWSSRGNNSGNLAVTFNGSYGCVEDEQAGGKGYCAGDAVEIRRCVVPPKEEKSYCIGQDVGGGDGKAFFPAFGFGAALDVARKEEDASVYSGRAADGGAEALGPVKAGGEATRAGASWKTGSHDGCYLPPTPQSEAYHGFFAGIGEQVKAESLQAGQHHPHHAFLDDQGPACLLMTREGLDLDPPGRRQECMLSEDHCALTYDLEGTPLEGGERKQKKRDQNKTAAHRYRQRKRAELDVLEEQLHGLEGRNRELRDKAESVEREIQYVKDLLIEVYKARSQRLKQDATA